MARDIIIIALLLFFIAAGYFAQDNVGPCTCDLTQTACDPNCCCDTDCNATDIKAFSACSNDYSFSGVQSCFPSSIMYHNYTPYTVNMSSGDGLACIYYDRFTARNFYTSPQVLNSNVTKVALKAQAYAGFSFAVATSATNYSVYDASYKAGTRIHTLYESFNPSYLRQPAALNSRSCSYSTPVLFMNSLASVCTRLVTRATCATDGALGLSSFVTGFRVVPQPSWLTASSANASLNYTQLTEVTRGSLTCRAIDGSTFACPNVTTPTFNGTANVCNYVLTSLSYFIKYTASVGIYEVSYDAVLTNTDVSSSSGYSLKQTFTTAFNLSQTSSVSSYPRSGNPGYILGKPVLAGTRNLTTNSVLVNADPALWLTVPGAGADGACSSATSAARSVAFGESLQSGCWRQLAMSGDAIDAAACANISATVRASLAGLGVDGNTVVGRFGNTADTSLTDWQLVHVENATCAAGLEKQSGTACVNLMLGGRLELLVARTGSVTNPQSSIVGARLRCVRGNVTFQCAAGTCSSGSATQRFLTSYSVRFIDASSTTTSALTSPTSIFQQRLMTDFFYLLYVENGAVPATAAAPASICWLLCLAAASYWLA